MKKKVAVVVLTAWLLGLLWVFSAGTAPSGTPAAVWNSMPFLLLLATWVVLLWKRNWLRR